MELRIDRYLLILLQGGVYGSLTQRWQLEHVQHDAPVDKDIAPTAYRPPNLAALIEQATGQEEMTIQVVGWDGEVIPPGEVPWPRI